MLDWSQPTHFYDADRIANKQIIIRMAHQGEALTLLDNAKLELTEHDMVVADAEKPLCLAGVRGGLYDSVTPKTKALFLEAATFDAGTVRRSALGHKTRTDASARFEKTLDANMPIEAIERFCKLCETYNVKATPSEEIISVGKGAVPEIIEVTHTFFEQRIGMQLTEHDIVDALTRLEFGVLKSINRNHEVTYLITIPTFRSSKDVKIKEDILEEVLRCWGFEKIKPVLAQLTRLPYSLEPVFRLRKIKRFLAHGCTMIEQQNYAMLDERFLQQINMQQNATLSIVNPVSENYARMAPSLIPGLLKNIKENHINRNDLSFFECGRIWLNNNDSVAEQKSLAGIFFKKHGSVDFFELKQKLVTLINTINLDTECLRFAKTEKTNTPWYHQFQTAEIFYENKSIGFAGKMDTSCIKKLDIDAPCDAFIFELNLDILLTTPEIKRKYTAISKFQESYVDISVLAPYSLTTQEISTAFLKINELVKKVVIIDFFEKKEWTDVRSLTYRLWISHDTRNLEKQDIDTVLEVAIAQAKSLGVTVRMEK
jgi:phenylalanyl-tRNA synthetase beta chain